MISEANCSPFKLEIRFHPNTYIEIDRESEQKKRKKKKKLRNHNCFKIPIPEIPIIVCCIIKIMGLSQVSVTVSRPLTFLQW